MLIQKKKKKRSAQFLNILIFPSEVDLQAESRGRGRSELPELHIQVVCAVLCLDGGFLGEDKYIASLLLSF